MGAEEPERDKERIARRLLYKSARQSFGHIDASVAGKPPMQLMVAKCGLLGVIPKSCKASWNATLISCGAAVKCSVKRGESLTVIVLSSVLVTVQVPACVS